MFIVKKNMDSFVRTQFQSPSDRLGSPLRTHGQCIDPGPRKSFADTESLLEGKLVEAIHPVKAMGIRLDPLPGRMDPDRTIGIQNLLDTNEDFHHASTPHFKIRSIC